MMKRAHHSTMLWHAALAIIIVLLAVLVWASFFMIRISLCDLSGKDVAKREMLLREEAPEVSAWLDSLRSTGVMRDTFRTTADGRRLHAVYMAAKDSTVRTMIVVHGYTCNAISTMKIARMFRDRLGLNLFIPELHGHGLSDGDEVQMGWKDADDVIDWVPVVKSLFCDSSDVRIAVQGVSMGAATIMNMSGKESIPQIKCYIEDCGYTSVWDEFASELKNRYGLPPFPLMYTTSLLCKWRYGWSFGEAAPLKMVSRCDKPMLFIHGDNDDFVPSWMVHPLYEAKHGKKSIWITKGTDHGHSFRDYPEEYERRVRTFLESSGM
jgi:fermentation-respiration switch protein FrsA (DUF1100 family)